MENPYRYRPKRPTPLSIFIIVAMLLNAFIVIKAIIGGIDVVGFYPVNADTSKKPQNGAGGVSWQNERSTAKSLNAKR